MVSMGATRECVSCAKINSDLFQNFLHKFDNETKANFRYCCSSPVERRNIFEDENCIVFQLKTFSNILYIETTDCSILRDTPNERDNFEFVEIYFYTNDTEDERCDEEKQTSNFTLNG